jgi:TRAP-type C4-dicarboxylate transport system permease large subunit
MAAEVWLLVLTLGVFLALVLWLKLPVGLSLAATGVATAFAAGDGFPLRHLVEGMFAYLDVALVLITAMIFMKVIEQNGLLDVLARDLILKFGRSPLALLSVMTLIIMFPGAITGSCTASVLSTGVLMLPVLGQMNMPRARAAAVIAMASVYGMIAPPVNIIVMIIGGGIDMPYIGFDLILLLITVPLAILTTVYLGYRYARTVDPKLAAAALRRDGMPQGRMLYLPLLAVAVLMIGPKALPQVFPDPRLPLTFAIGSLIGLCVGRKVRFMEAARRAITDILPVVGILMGVGLLIQIMTLTGIRGSIAVNSLSLPAFLLLLSIAVSLPLFGGISVFGASSILGVPFILTFLGQNLIVTAAAMSLIAAMGSFTPPVALTAVIAAQVVGEPSYMKVVRPLIVPSLVAIGIGIALIVYADSVARIVGL